MKKLFFLALLILAVYFAINAYAENENICLNKTYTIETVPSLAYPDDDGLKLTDGEYAAADDNEQYNLMQAVGFNVENVNNDGDFVITVDLNEKKASVDSFSVSYISQPSASIFPPSYISVSISDTFDGEYTHLGSQTVSDKPKSFTPSSGKVTFTPTNEVSCRYIRYSIHPISQFEDNGETITPNWIFIDEIEAIENVSLPKTGDTGIVFLLVLAIISVSALLGRKLKKN